MSSPGSFFAVVTWKGPAFLVLQIRAMARILGMAACHEIFDLVNGSKAPPMWTATNRLTCYAGDHPHRLAFRCTADRVETVL